ncbi:hypothetical protein DY000_02022827 [Brassica cretica]|uniref:Secreted protein n=1 Tax=Brassica cretica TaxID=69181 RepID=A0ABQ7EHT8_BRACR|nr:hypothetical protein DY000_02022827 [Brassica cretica]
MRGRSNRLRVSLVHLSLSLSLSLSLYLDHLSLETLSTKGESSPSVSLIGDVSVSISHRRHLRRYLSSVTSRSVALIGDLSLGGSPGGDRALSRLLVLSFGGSSRRSFPSVAQIEAFTSNRKKAQSSFTKGSSSSGVHGKIRFVLLLTGSPD